MKYINDKYFNDFFSQNPFVLFVGAGINGDLVVQWKALLQELQDKAFQLFRGVSQSALSQENINQYCNNLSIETQADLYQIILGDMFPVFLKKILYKNYSEEKLHWYMNHKDSQDLELNKQYKLLYYLASLSQKKNLIGIVTLNYDNYLEMSINHLPVSKSKPIRHPISIPDGSNRLPHQRFKGQKISADNVIPIHHIHGFLPYLTTDMAEDTEDVILSQSDYLDAFSESDNLSSSTAVHYLSNYPTLFIGLSMLDWNLLRFLSQSLRNGRKFPHFAICKTEGKCDIMTAAMLEQYGVNLLFCPEGPTDDKFCHVRDKINDLIKQI